MNKEDILTEKQKERILRRYMKELKYDIAIGNYEPAKRIIDNIKKLKEEGE